MGTRWFRHYAGMMADPKFGGVARRCKRPRSEVLFVWGMILESAAETNLPQYRFDADEAADLLSVDTDVARAIHDELERSGLLAGGKIAAWERRQFLSDVSTERVKQFRKRRHKDSETSEERCRAGMQRPQSQNQNQNQNQIQSSDSEWESEPEGKALARSAGADEINDAIEIYNSIAKELDWPQAQILSEIRRKKLVGRLRECGGLQGWQAAMEKARASSFLRGERGRDKAHESWTPHFDFFLQASSFTKLMEGKYDDRDSRQEPTGFAAVLAGVRAALDERAHDKSHDRGGGLGSASDCGRQA